MASQNMPLQMHERPKQVSQSIEFSELAYLRKLSVEQAQIIESLRAENRNTAIENSQLKTQLNILSVGQQQLQRQLQESQQALA